VNLVLDRTRPEGRGDEGEAGPYAVVTQKAQVDLDPDYSYRAVAALARRSGPPQLRRLVAGAPPAPPAVGAMPTDAA
jgi:hypothetical protein